MRILIVSDTHRYHQNYLKVLEVEKPIDLLLHCGDVEGGEDIISEGAGCPTHIVLGNNDFFSSLAKEEELKIGTYRVLLTHGHNYGVSVGTETIKEEARSRNLNMVIFGHTHKPMIEKSKDMVVMNPGSLTYPRQEGKKPSYIMLEILDSGETTMEIRYL